MDVLAESFQNSEQVTGFVKSANLASTNSHSATGMPIGLIQEVKSHWEPKAKFRIMKPGSVASLIKTFHTLDKEALKERKWGGKATSLSARQKNNVLRAQQPPTASPTPRSRSNPFVRRDSTASPMPSSPPPAITATSSNLPIQEPSPVRRFDATTFESQVRRDDWAPDSRAGFGKRHTGAFANPAGRRTSRPWALHSPEIENRHNSRPLVRRACGHLEPTATVPVPGGENVPGMIEQLEDGTYILVGPKLKDETDSTDPTTGEVVPILCAECQKRQQRLPTSPPKQGVTLKSPHMLPGDQDYWRDRHVHEFYMDKPKRRVSMSEAALESDARLRARTDRLAVWSPPRDATPYSVARPPLSPLTIDVPPSDAVVTDHVNGPLESFPESGIVDHSLAMEILRDLELIMTEHTISLNTVISNLQSERPKVDKIKDLSRKLAQVSQHLHQTSHPDYEQKPPPQSVDPQLIIEPKSADEGAPSLDDPPRLLRRRTQSVPQLLQLIDTAANDLGLNLPGQKLRPALPLWRTNTNPDDLLQSARPITIHEPSTPPFRAVTDYSSPPSTLNVPRTASPSSSSTVSSTSRYSQPSLNGPRADPGTPPQPGKGDNGAVRVIDEELFELSPLTESQRVGPELELTPSSAQSSRRTSDLPKNGQDIIDEAFRALTTSYPVPAPPPQVIIHEPTIPIPETIPEVPSHPPSPPQPPPATPVPPPSELQIIRSDTHGPDCPAEPHLHVPGDWNTHFPLQLYDSPAPPPSTPDERAFHQVGQFWSSGLRMANHHLQELARIHSEGSEDSGKKQHRPNSPLSLQFWSTGVRSASNYLQELSHHHSDPSHDVGATGATREPPSYLQHDPSRRPSPSPKTATPPSSRNTALKAYSHHSEPLVLDLPHKDNEARPWTPVPRTRSVSPTLSAVPSMPDSIRERHFWSPLSMRYIKSPKQASIPTDTNATAPTRRESAPVLPTNAAQQTSRLPPFLRNTPFATYIAMLSTDSHPPPPAPESEASLTVPPSPDGVTLLSLNNGSTSEFADDEASNVGVTTARSRRSKMAGSPEHWARVSEQVRARSRGRVKNDGATANGVKDGEVREWARL